MFNLAVFLIPVLLSSSSISRTETHVYSSSGSVMIDNEVTAEADGTKIEVKSNQPGKIEVQVKDGEVKIEKSDNITPTVTVSGAIGQTTNQAENQTETVQANQDLENQPKIVHNVSISNKVLAFFKDIVLKFLTTFNLRKK